MNKHQFNKFLGIKEIVPKYKGDPFLTFANKSEANKYLLEKKIISPEEYFLRENPELRTKPSLSTNEPY